MRKKTPTLRNIAAADTGRELEEARSDPSPTGRGINSKDTKSRSATAAQKKATKPSRADAADRVGETGGT